MEDGLVLSAEDVADGAREDHGVLPRGVVQVPRPRERRPLLHATVRAGHRFGVASLKSPQSVCFRITDLPPVTSLL